MSNPNPERDERVADDSKAAAQEVWDRFWADNTSEKWSVSDIQSILRPHFVIATTRMRDRCVEKVREHLHAHPSEDMQSLCGHNHSIQEVIDDLQSLTLEQGEQQKENQ